MKGLSWKINGSVKWNEMKWNAMKIGNCNIHGPWKRFMGLSWIFNSAVLVAARTLEYVNQQPANCLKPISSRGSHFTSS